MNRPTIKNLCVRNQRFFWIKAIQGVDLSKCCAKCFLGPYSKGIEFGKHNIDHQDYLLENEAKYYYMCGVFKGQNYHRNTHIAFQYRKGSQFEVFQNDIKCIILDAELITINKPQNAKGSPSQLKCRNWWFANQIRHQFVEK